MNTRTNSYTRSEYSKLDYYMLTILQMLSDLWLIVVQDDPEQLTVTECCQYAVGSVCWEKYFKSKGQKCWCGYDWNDSPRQLGSSLQPLDKPATSEDAAPVGKLPDRSGTSEDDSAVVKTLVRDSGWPFAGIPVVTEPHPWEVMAFASTMTSGPNSYLHYTAVMEFFSSLKWHWDTRASLLMSRLKTQTQLTVKPLPLNQNTQCPSCFEQSSMTVLYAVQFCCGVWFCSDCRAAFEMDDRSCPMCRENPTQDVIDLRNSLQDIVVEPLYALWESAFGGPKFVLTQQALRYANHTPSSPSTQATMSIPLLIGVLVAQSRRGEQYARSKDTIRS